MITSLIPTKRFKEDHLMPFTFILRSVVLCRVMEVSISASTKWPWFFAMLDTSEEVLKNRGTLSKVAASLKPAAKSGPNKLADFRVSFNGRLQALTFAR